MSELLGFLEGRLRARTGEARRIRQAAGLTLRELAAYVGVNPSTVHRWEHGDMRPQGIAALRYAQALETIAARLAQAGLEPEPTGCPAPGR